MWAALVALTMSTTPAATTDWVNLGPGSPITAFAVDPSDPGTVYASIGDPFGRPLDSPDYRGTIFKTTDGGAHWRELLVAGLTTAIVVDPVDPARLWALQGASGRWLYRSTDGGEDWAVIGPPFAELSVDLRRALAISVDGTVLYAGGSFWDSSHTMDTCTATTFTSGYRSRDEGGTWSREVMGFAQTVSTHYSYLCPPLARSPDVETLAFDFFDSNIVYAIADRTLLHRSAGGDWSSDLMPECIVTAVAPRPLGPGYVRIGTRPRTSFSKCSLLLDSAAPGLAFAPTASPVPADTDGTVDALAFNREDPNVAFVALRVFSPPPATGQFVFATADNGDSWRDLRWPARLPVYQLALDADGRTLYAVSDSGIFARKLLPVRGAPRTVPFRR